jgi:uncharacterized membrane protein YhaH (DUF805 family)
MTDGSNAELDRKIQAALDQDHLSLLSIGFMISGGTSAFFSLFGLLYGVLGLVLVVASEGATASHANSEPPIVVAWIFGLFGLAIFLLMITLAVLKFRAAWCLKQHRSRTFCMVMAGVSCLGIPYGTVLGVFAFIVLGRESIRELFAVGNQSSEEGHS